MYDAIVLAGGSARRLGGVDKPALEVGGRSLLEHVVGAVPAAARVVVAGPERELAAEVRDDVVWCREHPPGGGPVAALAAAVPHTRADVVLVLAADLPRIVGAVQSLIDAVPGNGTALLVDAAGRANYLAAAWGRTALVAALGRVGDVRGASMRALLHDVERVEVPDVGGWGADCDTWVDVDAARRHQTDVAHRSTRLDR